MSTNPCTKVPPGIFVRYTNNQMSVSMHCLLNTAVFSVVGGACSCLRVERLVSSWLSEPRSWNRGRVGARGGGREGGREGEEERGME